MDLRRKGDYIMTKHYKYTDKEDFQVELTEQQVVELVRISQEIRKTSPSNRLSRPTLKAMIQDSNLAYVIDTTTLDQRFFSCLTYWESQVLASEPENERPIDAIRNKVGEMALEKRAIANETRQINKIKRAISDELLFHEELKISLQNIDLTTLSIPKNIDKSIQGAHVGVFCPSDLHIGLGDKENQRRRFQEYVTAAIKYFTLFDVKEVKAVGLGDIVENAIMHAPTSTESCWGSNAEQINEYISLIIQALNELSHHFNVEYLGDIRGNHDENRAGGQKGAVLENDSYSFIATNMISTLINTINNPNLTANLDGYSHDLVEFSIKGFNFVAEHGDKSKKGVDKLARYTSQLRYQVNYILSGHFHNYKTEVSNYGDKVFTSGTMNNSNAYSKGLGYFTDGSQMIILVNDRGAQSLYIDTEVE